MTTTAPEKVVVFRSVDRPWLSIEADDVETCDECGHLSASEYAATVARLGHDCPTCRGWRLVHGYASDGRGYPVEVSHCRVED